MGNFPRAARSLELTRSTIARLAATLEDTRSRTLHLALFDIAQAIGVVTDHLDANPAIALHLGQQFAEPRPIGEQRLERLAVFNELARELDRRAKILAVVAVLVILRVNLLPCEPDDPLTQPRNLPRPVRLEQCLQNAVARTQKLPSLAS